MSDFALHVKEGGSMPHNANEFFSSEFINKPDIGCSEKSSESCSVIDDTDVICEEVVVESSAAKTNGLKNFNASLDGEVICIEDSEDETPCSQNLGPVGNKNVLIHVPRENGSNLEFLYPDARSILSLTSINASPEIGKVLCDIGFNLILCKFFSNNDMNSEDSIKHLNAPLKHCKCGFKSESALIFNSHVNLLDGIPLKCCLCKNFSARRLKKLAMHMKNVHAVPEYWAEKYPSYQCHFCEHNANTPASLKKHTRNCTSKFILNSNLAPRNEEQQSLFFDGISKSSRAFSVIYPNPMNGTSGVGVSANDLPPASQTTQASVIVPNGKGHKNISHVIECGYCKASLKDLSSLGVHMEVVHSIRYSFESSASEVEDKPMVVVPDEGVGIGENLDANYDRPSFSSSSPGSTGRTDVDVEKELAKMALRRECLWCCRRFDNLEMFEDHMIEEHDDLKCDIEGFWLAIEAGLRECTGSKTALEKVCPLCRQSFETSSSCHRHILNKHWKLHLEECQWCCDITTLQLPYLNMHNGEMDVDALESANESDSTSTSSFLSDIDSKEVLR